MDLIILAFQGIPLGGSGGPDKDRMFWFLWRLYVCSPRIRLASWMSFSMMVTRLAWMAQRLVSSNSPTRYASEASCRASTAAC